MFPTLFASFGKRASGVYFGGRDVPPYLRRQCAPDATPEQILDEVRLIMHGRACSGYVAEDGIYLHMYGEDDQDMHVDLSREFIIIADPDADVPVLPTAWHLLRFLQEPARRALWMDRTSAVYAEKSDRTMALCRELDALWHEDAFLPLVQDAAVNADAHDRLLPVLMRRYEERTSGDPSVMWQFYDTFAPLLAHERLFLTVRSIREHVR